MMNADIVSISCPECQQLVDLDSNLTIGQQATCQFCNTGLVVIWLFPVCLDIMESEEQVAALQDFRNY